MNAYVLTVIKEGSQLKRPRGMGRCKAWGCWIGWWELNRVDGHYDLQ